MSSTNNTVIQQLDNNKNKEDLQASKSDSQNTKKYLNEIKQFESNREELKSTLVKVGFACAGFFAIISVLLAISISVLTPLKEEIITLMILDRITGRMEVLSPMADAKETTYGEVLDRHWIKEFVRSRNGYDWDTVQHNYNKIKLMSDSEVFGEYQTYITGPNSPVKNYEDNRVVKISGITVSFLPDVAEKRIAQINFQRDVKSSNGKPVVGYEPTLWTATVTFDYLAEIKTDDERDLNPLKFRVTSYDESRVID